MKLFRTRSLTDGWGDSVNPVRNYIRLVLRLAWQPWLSLKSSVVRQNLLDPRHPEVVVDEAVPSEVPGSFYVQVRISF